MENLQVLYINYITSKETKDLNEWWKSMPHSDTLKVAGNTSQLIYTSSVLALAEVPHDFFAEIEAILKFILKKEYNILKDSHLPIFKLKLQNYSKKSHVGLN